MDSLDVLQGGRATYSPEEMKVITAAFAEAWADIVLNIDSSRATSKMVRSKLARAILQAASAKGRDVDALKASALLAVGYLRPSH